MARRDVGRRGAGHSCFCLLSMGGKQMHRAAAACWKLIRVGGHGEGGMAPGQSEAFLPTCSPVPMLSHGFRFVCTLLLAFIPSCSAFIPSCSALKTWKRLVLLLFCLENNSKIPEKEESVYVHADVLGEGDSWSCEAGIKGGSPGLAKLLGMVRYSALLLVVVELPSKCWLDSGSVFKIFLYPQTPVTCKKTEHPSNVSVELGSGEGSWQKHGVSWMDAQENSERPIPSWFCTSFFSNVKRTRGSWHVV